MQRLSQRTCHAKTAEKPCDRRASCNVLHAAAQRAARASLADRTYELLIAGTNHRATMWMAPSLDATFDL